MPPRETMAGRTPSWSPSGRAAAFVYRNRLDSSGDIFPHTLPSFSFPLTLLLVQLSHCGIRLVLGSHGDEADLIRDQGDSFNLAQRGVFFQHCVSLGNPPQKDSLMGLVLLIGTCGRSEHGTLVSWLVIKSR